MSKVTTPIPYGTVDYFADRIRATAERSVAHPEVDVMAVVLGLIQSITRDAGHLGNDRAVEIIAHVFAAEALVRAELAGGAR